MPPTTNRCRLRGLRRRVATVVPSRSARRGAEASRGPPRRHDKQPAALHALDVADRRPELGPSASGTTTGSLARTVPLAVPVGRSADCCEPAAIRAPLPSAVHQLVATGAPALRSLADRKAQTRTRGQRHHLSGPPTAGEGVAPHPFGRLGHRFAALAHGPRIRVVDVGWEEAPTRRERRGPALRSPREGLPQLVGSARARGGLGSPSVASGRSPSSRAVALG
jgi:hypothetical protein